MKTYISEKLHSQLFALDPKNGDGRATSVERYTLFALAVRKNRHPFHFNTRGCGENEGEVYGC